jgi:osmoprotectant transport system substrate-binding protein
MTSTRTIRAGLAAVAALVLALGLVACGDDDDEGSAGGGGSTATTQEQPSAAITSNPDNAQTTLTIGSKNFTEQKVLGEIYAQALQAAGYKIRKELNLGDEQTALKALKGGDIDGYPEYTGTALLSFFEVPTKDLPKDATAAYDEVKSKFASDGITAFPPTPFTSSNEVAVTQETAQKLGLENISDLDGKSQDLTLYGSPECRGRDDCLRGLQNVYGLRFKRFVPVDIAQRHEVLTNGDADISIVFTTDPQIARNKEVLLKDDKGMFPPYNSTFLMKTETADKAGPDLQKTIEVVNKNLTARVMQELNARVDLDKETPEEAAADYLQQFDLVAAGS